VRYRARVPSPVLSTILAVALLLFALAVHEAAHALALRTLGYRIVEAGLGLPFPPRLVITPRRLPFRVSLSPWLLGAYVKAEERLGCEIDTVPYRATAWYLGAGVIANLLLGGVAGCLATALQSHWTKTGILALGTAVLWFSRRLICAYVLPIVGIPTLAWLGYLMATSVGEPQGPLGLGKLAGEMAVSASVYNALAFCFVINVGLGLLNLIPIYPFDGGRIADTAIKRLAGVRPALWFRRVTGFAALWLIVYSTVGDLVWLALR
jgi:membrane-associated protease RseP (regulator of RpoE activity)